MKPTSTEDVARRFLQAWNAGHLHVVDELAAPRLTVSYTHFPEPFEGPEAFKEMLAETHAYFPGLSIEVEEVVAEGNRAALHWVYRGTFEKGEMFGVRAAGQRVEVTGMTIHRIEGGLVQREHGLVDNAGLMRQLGA